MKAIITGSLLMITIAVSGCASSGVNTRLDALEAELSQVKRAADLAMQNAREAQATSSASKTEIAQAKRMAQEAIDTATEAAERASRMQDECCGGK